MSIMNRFKEFFVRMWAEMDVSDMAHDRPDDVQMMRYRVKKYGCRGYPVIETENDYIFWDEFSKRYGLEPPRWKLRKY